MSGQKHASAAGSSGERCGFILLSRPGCHLCHEMESLLESEMQRLGESFVVRDVDSRPEWRREFGSVVPVLLRDGRPVAKVRVDRKRLRRIVARSRVD